MEFFSTFLSKKMELVIINTELNIKTFVPVRVDAYGNRDPIARHGISPVSVSQILDRADVVKFLMTRQNILT